MRLKLISLKMILAVSVGVLSWGGAPQKSPSLYSHLPLVFEGDPGPAVSGVRYVARSSSGFIALSDSGASLYLRDSKLNKSVRVGVRPVRPNSSMRVEGIDDTGGKSNYFIGNDPSRWRTNVSNYGKVRYRNVYDGIDLLFHGNQRNIEYDFVVSPGGDPSRIEVEFSGARSLRLTPEGDLIVDANGLALTQHKPVLYQEKNGARTEVSGGYVIRGSNRAAFRIGAYDRSRTLVIDPVLTYSLLLGGSGVDFGIAVAIDAAGNVYLTGSTNSYANFPMAPSGTFTAESVVLMCKLNPSGTAVVYTAFIGGSDANQLGTGIAVDAVGSAYVTGFATSSTFPITATAYQKTVLGNSAQHPFVFKLNPSGAALVYSTWLAGSISDQATAIAIDAGGNAYITGQANSADFPVTQGSYQASPPQGANAFVAKLNSTGTNLVYSTFLGGIANDGGIGIAVDSSGSAYVAGSTGSYDFPTTPGSFQPNPFMSPGTTFVAKFNPAGSALVYSTLLTTGTTNTPGGIAVDSSGSAYITGSGSPPISASPTLIGPRGFGDIFVVKLNPAASALSYETLIGGSLAEASAGIALDSAGNVYVAGSSESGDFPLLSPVQAIHGVNDMNTKNAVIFKLDSGGALAYSTYLGGFTLVFPYAIAADSASGTVVSVGLVGNLDFPVTPGAVASPASSEGDIFVAKLNTTQACTYSLSASSSGLVDKAGANSTVDVTAPSGCNWIVRSNQPWIAVTSPAGVSGNGTVSYTVQANQDIARSAPVSVAGQLFNVSQANGCTYALSAPSANVSSSGAVIRVNMITGGGQCPWGVSGVPDWMTIVAGQPFVGPSTLVFNVLANETGQPRSAILTIAGNSYLVSEDGGFTCAYSINPTTWNFPQSGGLGSSVFITTSSGCSWSVASDSAWMRIVNVQSTYGMNPSLGIGNGYFDYFSDSNTGATPRTAKVSVAGLTFTVTEAGTSAGVSSKTGIFRNGIWVLDVNGDGVVNYSNLPPDRAFQYTATPGDIQITGDWNGDGKTKTGIFRNGLWILDANGNGVVDNVNQPGGDLVFQYTATPGDIPVVGDWNGDGRTKTGVFRNNGIWILDVNGDGVINYANLGVDKVFQYTATGGDIPVIGDWNGDGKAKTGIFRNNGTWILDVNGDGVINYANLGVDRVFQYTATPGDVPVIGDWNGDGRAKTGIFRSGIWILDVNGDGLINYANLGVDKVFQYTATPGDIPVVGDWNADGKAKTGVFRNNGVWILDVNGDGVINYANLGVDRVFQYTATPGDKPLVGRW